MGPPRVELYTNLVATRNRIWVLLAFPDFPEETPPYELVIILHEAITDAIDPVRWCIRSAGTQAFSIGPIDLDHALSEEERIQIESALVARLEGANITVEVC